MKSVLSRFLFLVLLCLLTSAKVNAYAILAHEAIIDACWEKQIKPLLKERFPAAADSDIKKAHAYAYGGSMIPDMGYMPMGSMEFSDLMHYVRSGDMVKALLDEAQNIDEFAFALGALSHYLADQYGHSGATNLTVPDVYKKMKFKYGNFVTYGDDHVSHSRIEFSYDVLQVARGDYSPLSYHDFIGFKVAKPVLERAFFKTYGERLDDLFSNFDTSVSTLRWGINKLFPTLIRKTWKAERDTIMKRQPGITARQFKYKMKRREYYTEFGTDRVNPGFTASVLTFIIHVMPKIGPLKTLKYVDPGAQGEKFFVKSFDTILVCYAAKMNDIRNNRLQLPNIDFDTGRLTAIDEYPLADQSYAQLMVRLNDRKFKYISTSLKQHMLYFYKDPDKILNSKHYPFKCDELAKAIKGLKAAQSVSEKELLQELTQEKTAAAKK